MGLRVGGLVSGLDTQALVDGLLALERRPLELARQRRQNAELEQSLFRDLNTKILALRDAAAALDNQNPGLSGPSSSEELLAFVATSSDETVVLATASGDASPGSNNVNVNALASASRDVSTGYATETEVVANDGDTLTLDVNGQTIEITVGAGGASLVGLRSLINEHPDNGGLVRANILFDGIEQRLIVSGMATGVANDVTVSSTIMGGGGGDFFDIGLSSDATDAQLEVFGVPITRGTNTVADAIPGVTLDLRATSAATVQVQVERDDAAIGEKVQAFVDAYNEIADFVKTQSAFNAETELSGPLSGDSTLRGIELTLQRAISTQFSFTGNPFTSLGQIGVEIDETGKLTLDSEELNAALDSDSASVRELLGGDGVGDGAASALARQLDPITETGTGLLASRDDGFDTKIKSLDRQIERLELRLESREELLLAQFTRMESTLAALRGQGDSLLALVTGNNR